MADKALKEDSARFLTILLGPCDGGTGEHAWRKCKRCNAIAQLENHDPLAHRLVQAAIDHLRTEEN